MQFEWDPQKAIINFQKHGVSFREASTVFQDTLSMTYPDQDHSTGESRYVMIGLSRYGQLLVIAHTERANRIRIISARRATRNEQRFYEEDD
ncbi:hypothetical protein C1752_01566 [Acaryochloris thomasi RCC1774]|uniref:BrnT family toxin n=1 Tax=Acaryochloris thomasi RCC1774 TaxID=1764569 RepID=A0A2W1JWG9_9CYAN|nr:BrnT family toxin [Acaryochloris thomasi]PZD74024.1 hypothetical protein C1752_01566 [Acaryochloris thomasi RCC1774]